jgi:DUF4097 and DUF4098 domain-containing protein YvlB
MKTLFVFVLALLANLAFGFTDTVTKEFEVGEGGTLYLESDLGSISVKSSGSNQVRIVVTRKIKSGLDDDVDAILKRLDMQFRQSGNDVHVDVDYDRPMGGFFDSGRRQLNLHFEVEVPSVFNIDLKTAGGSISVDDLQGTVRVKTSGGSITLGQILGPVWANTSGGSISLTASKGDADLRTSGGSLTIGDVEGTIEGHTSGGSITVEEARGNVDVSTSGGGIKVNEVAGDLSASTSGGSITAYLSRQPQSDCRLTTSGGGINVYLLKDVNVTVDAATSGGHVSTDFPVTVQGKLEKSKLQGKINGGGPELYLRTSGGSINIYEK